jgi:hypothetical protein
MTMDILKTNGSTVRKSLPPEFTPFRSGLAGQPEKHAEKLELWIEEHMSIKCQYQGFSDGIVRLAEIA